MLTTLHNLRQQGEHRDGIRTGRWGFIAPGNGVTDFIGASAVTAGLGSQEKIMEFKAALDDYSAILLESVADRLAEAFAERMHQRVREEFWGYQPDEQLDNDALDRGAPRRYPPGPWPPGPPGATPRRRRSGS